MPKYTYNKFIVSDLPVKVQPGLCMHGSEVLGKLLTSRGLTIKYCYDPPHDNWQGHMWLLVQNPNKLGWLAIDPVLEKTEDWHYNPPIIFDNFKDIWKYIPKIKI
jgi:hypothetical protein